MENPTNDNRPPRRRLVPLLGVIHEDGTFERYKVVELLPHPLDLVDELAGDARDR